MFSDGNVFFIVYNFEDIGLKFIFFIKVGKFVIRMEKLGERGEKRG